MVQFLEGRNRAWAQLDAPINGSDTNVALVAWQGSRLSDVTTASGRKVRAQIYERDAETGAITKCELVNITNNVSDVLIIERAVESTRATDVTNTYAATPQSFTANAIIEEVISSEIISEIQDEVNRIETDKLDKSVYNAERALFWASSIGTDAYKITSADVLTYVNGQTFKIQADVANNWSATLELNSLWAKTIKKLDAGAFTNLITGDIIANQIFFATYNSVENCFQFSVDPANVTIPTISLNKLEDSTYPAWEDITAWNPVFIEPVTPYASATTFGNIGDQNANKRVSFPVFGSGVSGSTISLALKRILATTVDLTVRVETDNAGSPSGILAHVNANTTVDRTQMLSAPTSVNDDAVTTSSGDADTASAWYRIYANYTSILTTVNLSASCTATRVRLFSDAGALLSTATVISNVATFSYILVSWTYYRIEADNNGSSYTLRDWGGAWAPRNKTNINYISASLNQSATAYTGNSWNIHSIDTVGGFNNTITFPGAFTLINGAKYHVVVVSGTYGSENVDATNYYQIWYATTHTTTRGTKNWNGSAWSTFANSVFPYLSSTLCHDNILSKTSATYSYKIDWLGIASETKTVWLFPKVVIWGIDANQNWLTLWATQYIGNTAWSISSSAWSNSKKIGKAISSTQIKIIDIPL